MGKIIYKIRTIWSILFASKYICMTVTEDKLNGYLVTRDVLGLTLESTNMVLKKQREKIGEMLNTKCIKRTIPTLKK